MQPKSRDIHVLNLVRGIQRSQLKCQSPRVPGLDPASLSRLIEAFEALVAN